MGGTAGIDGYYDADGNWHAFAGLKWKFGKEKEPEYYYGINEHGQKELMKKDYKYQTTDVGEGYDYLKEMATGGIANHFRVR